MKVTAILNNYQYGSYPYKVLSQKVTNVEKIDYLHHLVTWELNKSEFELLKKVIYYKKLTIIKD